MRAPTVNVREFMSWKTGENGGKQEKTLETLENGEKHRKTEENIGKQGKT